MDIDPSNPAMEVLDRLYISDEAATELSGELSGDHGLVDDRTWGSGYLLVRWHDADAEE